MDLWNAQRSQRMAVGTFAALIIFGCCCNCSHDTFPTAPSCNLQELFAAVSVYAEQLTMPIAMYPQHIRTPASI
eukprot:6207506-Pleurochrysis_carterae.AAC.1